MKKTFHFFTALLPLLFVAFASISAAEAHALYVFAQYDGKNVSGKAYYSDQTPAAETYLEVIRQGEEQPALTGKTDKSGHFNFPLQNPTKAALKVIVEGEEGHRASVIADQIVASQNQTDSGGLLLLREEINQLKNKIYLHDILGGIGYIFGLVGVVAWFSARRLHSRLRKEN